MVVYQCIVFPVWNLRTSPFAPLTQNQPQFWHSSSATPAWLTETGCNSTDDEWNTEFPAELPLKQLGNIICAFGRSADRTLIAGYSLAICEPSCGGTLPVPPPCGFPSSLWDAGSSSVGQEGLSPCPALPFLVLHQRGILHEVIFGEGENHRALSLCLRFRDTSVPHDVSANYWVLQMATLIKKQEQPPTASAGPPDEPGSRQLPQTPLLIHDHLRHPLTAVRSCLKGSPRSSTLNIPSLKLTSFYFKRVSTY